jgi:hypothetical protein
MRSGHARERRRQQLVDQISPCLDRANLRRTSTIALVVGCVLTLINEGDVLIGGHVTGRTGIKIVLNFCVPFIVSNLGIIAGRRTEAGAADG